MFEQIEIQRWEYEGGLVRLELDVEADRDGDPKSNASVRVPEELSAPDAPSGSIPARILVDADPKRGPIHLLMADAHTSLDALLEETDRTGQINSEVYQMFRRGLLKHISMEEKILFLAAQRKTGEPLALGARLRLDHGALAALVALIPSLAIIKAIRTVLAAHNPLEEGATGVYTSCERILDSELDAVLALLRNAPEVRVSACVSGPNVLAATRRILNRAGYSNALKE